MAETKSKKDEDSISNSFSNIPTMAEMRALLDACNGKDAKYETYLNSAKEMMLVYKAHKEAGFSDEQAFRIVLTIFGSAIRSR